MSHLKVTQAGLVSLLTTIAGQVVAFVPAFAPDKQLLISAGSSAISAAFLLANAGHHLADSNVSTRDVEDGAIAAARSELAKVDFNALVSDAVNAHGIGDVSAMVSAEVQSVLGRLLGQLNQTNTPASISPAASAPVQPVSGAPSAT